MAAATYRVRALSESFSTKCAGIRDPSSSPSWPITAGSPAVPRMSPAMDCQVARLAVRLDPLGYRLTPHRRSYSRVSRAMSVLPSRRRLACARPLDRRRAAASSRSRGRPASPRSAPAPQQSRRSGRPVPARPCAPNCSAPWPRGETEPQGPRDRRVVGVLHHRTAAGQPPFVSTRVGSIGFAIMITRLSEPPGGPNRAARFHRPKSLYYETPRRSPRAVDIPHRFYF